MKLDMGMKTMTEEQLEKLHKIYLMVLVDLKKVCEKHGLHFFLVGGSMLGCVRHHGFIPWDDDTDVAMMREDYDRFMALPASELPSYFHIESYRRDNGYGLLCSKICVKGTLMESYGFFEGVECSHAIKIDLFPIDKTSCNRLLARRQFFEARVLQKLLQMKGDYKVYRSGIKKTLFDLMAVPVRRIPKKALTKAMDRVCLRYRNSREYMDASLGGKYTFPIEVPARKVYGECVELPFENTTMPVPAHYDYILTNFYGDYMKLPPEHKRDRQKIIALDFGEFESI